MRDYYITYAQGPSGPGLFRIYAANDDDAIVRLRRFIEQSPGDGCWGTVTLDDLREYQVRSEEGRLIGQYSSTPSEHAL